MLGHEVASACDSFDLLDRHCALAVQMACTHTAAMAVLARLTGGASVHDGLPGRVWVPSIRRGEAMASEHAGAGNDRLVAPPAHSIGPKHW
jgi:hypothetical protein